MNEVFENFQAHAQSSNKHRARKSQWRKWMKSSYTPVAPFIWRPPTLLARSYLFWVLTAGRYIGPDSAIRIIEKAMDYKGCEKIHGHRKIGTLNNIERQAVILSLPKHHRLEEGKK